MVEGPNFAFGHNREGDLTLLARLCAEAGLTLSVVGPVEVDGAEVSKQPDSRRIAARRRAGGGPCCWLGPTGFNGVVSEGARRGRTIGFPTANLEQVRTVVPGDGVYAVRGHDPQGRVWPGAANVGSNPTFAEQERKIEVHLIGYAGDLYGKTLAVDFLERLRDTRPFAGVAELKEQLGQDVERVREIVASGGATIISPPDDPR